MRPIEYVAHSGIDFFIANKGKTITVRLLSDDSMFFSGYFVGISKVGDELPLIEGLLINQAQYNLHLLCKDPGDGRIAPVKFNLLLVDDMNDIIFL